MTEPAHGAETKIFETDDYIVYYLDMGGDRIVISFSPMDFNSSSGTFWGSIALKKMRTSALGIVCKQNTWYPASLKGHLEQLTAITSRFKERICYGFSMGGYAAIKYSRCFDATTVLSLSPQSSLDPEDLDGRKPWYSNNFRYAIHRGMAIRSDDISGKVVIFYDPLSWEDVLSHSKIKDECLDLHDVRLWYTGHTTVLIFASTEALKGIFDYSSAEEWAKLQEHSARLRRSGPRRIPQILDRVIRRRQPLLRSFLERYWGEIDGWWKEELQKRHASLSTVVSQLEI